MITREPPRDDEDTPVVPIFPPLVTNVSHGDLRDPFMWDADPRKSALADHLATDAALRRSSLEGEGFSALQYRRFPASLLNEIYRRLKK